jgi:hypothetical protein
VRRNEVFYNPFLAELLNSGARLRYMTSSSRKVDMVATVVQVCLPATTRGVSS